MVFIAIGAIIFFGIFAFTGAPFVPSKRADLKTAFEELYPLSEKDLIVDFGAGDGKVLKFAERYGAKTVAVELNPALALVCKMRLRGEVVCQNYLSYRLPKGTTVVYTFADSRDIMKIYQRLQVEAGRLGEPIYLISLAFDLPKKIKPEKIAGPYYLYKIKPLVV